MIGVHVFHVSCTGHGMIQLLQPILHHELKGFRLGYLQVEILLTRRLSLLSRLYGTLTLGSASLPCREPGTLM